MKKFVATVFVVAVMIVVVLMNNAPGYRGREFDQGTIVAFGDSLTYGPEVGDSNDYPAQLQKLLVTKGYKNFKVINMGRNGDTVEDGLKRIDSVIAEKPDIVILTLGGNDFLRHLEPEGAQRGLDIIINTLQKSGIVVILGGMKAVGPQVSDSYKREFNNMYPTLAKKYDTLLIKDFLAGVRLHPAYNLADNIHPNEKGYAVIVQKNIWPIMKKLLK